MDKSYITKLVADAVRYLGDKIDSLRVTPQKIELDLTSKAIEKLQEIDSREMNALIKELQAVANGHAKSNTDLIVTLQAFEKATRDDSRMVDLLKTSQNLQRQTLSALERIKMKMLEPEKKDDKEYRLLVSIEKAIKGIKLEERDVDMKPIKELSSIMSRMESAQKKMDREHSQYMKSLTDAIVALPKQIKFEVPKTFKLDNEQLRSIRSAGGGAISLGTGGERTATRYTVANVALTDQNTPYAYTFPANTLSYTFKLRAAGANLYYSDDTDALPGGSGTDNYITLLPGLSARSQDNVEWSGKTIYFQSDTASQVVELEVFTL